jgi:hypothetical protein
VKDFKEKLNQLEKISLPRFDVFCKKLEEKGEMGPLKEKYKTRDLKELKGLGNLFSVFPEYLDFRLENLTLSRLFDRQNYSSFFFKKGGKCFFGNNFRKNK